MKKSNVAYLTESTFDHPVIQALNRIARDTLGIGLCVVFPQTDGWGHFYPGDPAGRTDFCRVVQGSHEGLKHCRMCHVLMSVATCSQQTLLEQPCHAGTSVLIAPASAEQDECFAVLSTCMFVRHGKPRTWGETKQRLAKLKVDERALKKAFHRLPCLDERQVRLASQILEAAAHAVRLIRERADADAECNRLRRHRSSSSDVRELVENRLRQSIPSRNKAAPAPSLGGPGGRPPLVEVVADLVTRRPDVPYSVAEVAAAARLSPNHFSSLFHKHMRQSFSEFLLQKRIELAKEILRDLTLNITEVARKVGYDDPGYFARRFKRKTGLTPRDWREQLAPL